MAGNEPVQQHRRNGQSKIDMGIVLQSLNQRLGIEITDAADTEGLGGWIRGFGGGGRVHGKWLYRNAESPRLVFNAFEIGING